MDIQGILRGLGGLAITDQKAHLLIHPLKMLSVDMHFALSL